ncbi:MAG: hypothetical protein AB7T63_08685 [Planctomycetota bacterium]
MAAARDEARLLLPSPLGLLEYDLLEGATFVGPAARGGLEAAPRPFAGALLVVAREAAGHVARALDDAQPVMVDGAPPTHDPLRDGARLQVGDQTAVFQARVVAPPVNTVEAPRRPPREVERRDAPPARPRRVPLWPFALVAAGLVLAAVVRGVEHMQDGRRAEEVLARDLPEPLADPTTDWPEDVRTLLELDASARARADGALRAELDRLRGALDRTRDPAVVAALRARWSELFDRLATVELGELADTVDRLATAGAFARANEEITRFERHFAGAVPADAVTPLRERVAREAAASLEVVLRDLAPLVTHAPRDAYVRLVEALDRFPVDLAPKLAPLLDVARRSLYGSVPPRPPVRDPGGDAGRGGADPGGDAPRAPDDGNDAGKGDEGPDADAVALKAWRTAHGDLLAGRYEQAAVSFRRLLDLHRSSTLLSLQRPAIEAAERWARAGRDGPHVLLHGEATIKRGRVQVSYEFDQHAELAEDFRAEAPFATDEPVEVTWEQGLVHIRLGTGLFHFLVYTDDVRIQATVRAEVAHDFGLLAVDDGARYRAILFNLANTRFKLKKGADATVQPGHVLWLIGEGVWAAADAGVHGFIKIAERTTSKLENMDRLQLELVRDGLKARGTMQGKTDGVHLEGAVKGDDGSGVGPARVGLFTHGTRMTIESVRIDGRVDPTWWASYLKQQVALLPTPP